MDYLKLRQLISTLCLLPMATFSALGQEDQYNFFDSLNVDWSGTIQPQASYVFDDDGNEEFGASVRRARLLLNGELGERLEFFLQLEGLAGSNNGATLLDARIAYRFAPNFKLRFGRMFVPQPRSFVYTVHRKMDGINRAAIAERWGGGTLGPDGRDYGLEVVFENDHWDAVAAIHNGHNQANFKTAISRFNNNSTGNSKGMAASFYGAYKPGFLKNLEIGGHYGYNGREGPYTELFDQGRDYQSFSGHIYWGAEPGSQPVRLKVDFIGTNYDRVNGVNQEYRGGALLAAVRARPWMELFGRFESMKHHQLSLLERGITPGGDDSYIYNGGVTVSFSALNDRKFLRNKLVLAYAQDNRGIGEDRIEMVQLQYQFVF